MYTFVLAALEHLAQSPPQTQSLLYRGRAASRRDVSHSALVVREEAWLAALAPVVVRCLLECIKKCCTQNIYVHVYAHKHADFHVY